MSGQFHVKDSFRRGDRAPVPAQAGGHHHDALPAYSPWPVASSLAPALSLARADSLPQPGLSKWREHYFYCVMVLPDGTGEWQRKTEKLGSAEKRRNKEELQDHPALISGGKAVLGVDYDWTWALVPASWHPGRMTRERGIQEERLGFSPGHKGTGSKELVRGLLCSREGLWVAGQSDGRRCTSAHLLSLWRTCMLRLPTPPGHRGQGPLSHPPATEHLW
ncbi:hypothetical protein P7K49_009053 [Saguinus oedipus]|uniref:Uncharacterized protein n=1 Tax=Saguinus oedipus TaxID=9490 RepID=A0ABQ9W332_SAGOE|nr:hypothetical protein P7K49_009053 [Saguinus oedipus]